MTKKTKPAGIEFEHSTLTDEELKVEFTNFDASFPGLRVSAAEELLVALEQRCMHGGSVGLDDIRAVLAKLRGAP